MRQGCLYMSLCVAFNSRQIKQTINIHHFFPSSSALATTAEDTKCCNDGIQYGRHIFAGDKKGGQCGENPNGERGFFCQILFKQCCTHSIKDGYCRVGRSLALWVLSLFSEKGLVQGLVISFSFYRYNHYDIRKIILMWSSKTYQPKVFFLWASERKYTLYVEDVDFRGNEPP